MSVESYDPKYTGRVHMANVLYSPSGMDKHLHLDVKIFIYPRNGTWTYGDTRRVLQAAQDIPSLRGIEGESRGFNLPRTPSVDAYIIRTLGAKNLGTADIRTHGWSMNDKEDATDDQVVTGGGDGDADCEVVMPFPGERSGIKTLVLLPKYGPTLQQLVDLAHVVETLGHRVVGSKGFDFSRGDGKLCEKGRTIKRFLTLRQARDAGIQIYKRDSCYHWQLTV